MANFKRRYPRIAGGGHYSEAFWRKRHNLKPIIIPDFDGSVFVNGHKSIEWLRFCEWRRQVCYPDSAPSQMANHPRWWDILHHTRPTRRKNKAKLIGIRRGWRDPDNTVWHDGRKPTQYYW
jgi:hypothetical protein